MSGNGSEAHPAVYAHQRELVFDAAIPVAELKDRASIFISELTGALKDNGCELIGHIKGLIDAHEKGHLMFSVTSFDEGARFKGKMADGIAGAELKVNVIVYGIEQEIIEAVYQKTLKKHFG